LPKMEKERNLLLGVRKKWENEKGELKEEKKMLDHKFWTLVMKTRIN
jgi:hypothetical protein